mmetsp:Transcript_13998/g.49730  ORF Transcript_13998/g.49730 Transcript_13998/m.49730 type:complete len:407 (+) Transcript_13998:69-1289(+)
MPVPSSLCGSLNACQKVISAVRADPKLLDEPELAFLKAFVNDDAETATPGPVSQGEAAAPRIPVNVADAPDDADWSLASCKKSAAAEAAAAGDLDAALAFLCDALDAEAATACLSAATLAKRADVLLGLGRPRAAISDCAAALQMNPDSAKAFKTRGKAHKALGLWTKANLDLAAAQNIDFDPTLKLLCDEVKQLAATEAAQQRDKDQAAELQKRKAAAKRRAEHKAEAQAAPRGAAGGPPGGMPGGMPGAPGGMDMAAAAEMMKNVDEGQMASMINMVKANPAMMKSMLKSNPMMGNISDAQIDAQMQMLDQLDPDQLKKMLGYAAKAQKFAAPFVSVYAKANRWCNGKLKHVLAAAGAVVLAYLVGKVFGLVGAKAPPALVQDLAQAFAHDDATTALQDDEFGV